MKGVENRFAEDIRALMDAIGSRYGSRAKDKLVGVAEKLIDLYSKGVVKINHSVMEMVCAAYLVSKGYDVDVEHPLAEPLVCDVYGKKGDGTFIVEIETGFTPPEHALDPLTYLRARIVSKVARYSAYADRFALATPRYNLLEIHRAIVKPPSKRTEDELEEMRSLCDLYYSRPPVSLEELRNARLHSVMVIEVDSLSVYEFDPVEYRDGVIRSGLSGW
ncbi:MAG: hypothetical protein NZ733_04680 [Aigarchaeota archaeon]|nr:hypothetical protein [Aigarchaeota archaeon]MCS7126814.1 hypothetical protein [Candidatus Calditenuaceae archaeon]MCX8203721.1 hypothetical protein [Nitrososphaeria archaeon]MDW8042991.1 hypothetical protein [Nitrososphaerota archaeon]